MRTIRRRRGFTLIELLIVISIILLLLAIAIPHVDKQMQMARELAVIREIGSGIEWSGLQPATVALATEGRNYLKLGD